LSNEWFSCITITMWSKGSASFAVPAGNLGYGRDPGGRRIDGVGAGNGLVAEGSPDAKAKVPAEATAPCRKVRLEMDRMSNF
jgi:hypothetical protein